MIRYLLFLLALLLSMPSLACGLAKGKTLQLESGMKVFFQTDVEPIPVAQHFSMQFQFCRDGNPVAVSEIKLDAIMPLHGHGMNYRAEVVKGKAGQFFVDGLMFHMPGKWRVLVDVKLEDSITRAKLDFQI